eukprot:3825201-Rhodomonas_salina.1
MVPSYKDHPIPELKGAELSGEDGSTCMRPTHAVYAKWLTSTRKVLGALVSFWMVPMALCLEFVLGVYVFLVDGELDDGDNPVGFCPIAGGRRCVCVQRQDRRRLPL